MSSVALAIKSGGCLGSYLMNKYHQIPQFFWHPYLRIVASMVQPLSPSRNPVSPIAFVSWIVQSKECTRKPYYWKTLKGVLTVTLRSCPRVLFAFVLAPSPVWEHSPCCLRGPNRTRWPILSCFMSSPVAVMTWSPDEESSLSPFPWISFVTSLLTPIGQTSWINDHPHRW